MMQTAQSLPEPTATFAAEKQRDTYVLLRAGTLHLLLPRTDVAKTGHIELRPQPGSDLPGVLRVPGQNDAMYLALSPELKLLGKLPEERFVYTVFAGADNIFWCWSDVQILIDTEITPLNLPKVLLTPQTPVQHMVQIGQTWAFPCRAQMLQEFIFSRLAGRA